MFIHKNSSPGDGGQGLCIGLGVGVSKRVLNHTEIRRMLDGLKGLRVQARKNTKSFDFPSKTLTQCSRGGVKRGFNSAVDIQQKIRAMKI